MHRHRNFRRFICSIAACAFFSVLYYFFTDNINLEYSADFDYDCQRNDSLVNPSIKHICFEEPHIFFVETSGSANLTSRQACAIESTAHHNPSMNIIVLMTTVGAINQNNNVIKLLLSLPNTQIIKIDMDVLFHGTPLFQWYRAGKWKKSQWKISHLSDALRFLLMWKYGGIYLDMDIVTLRSLEQLRNSAITENWDRVAAGILMFDKGHELLRKCVFDFARNYDPYNFVNNGPGVLTRNIKSYCDTDIISKVSGANCDVNILPPEAAFPILYDNWQDYFTPSSVKNITSEFNTSYLIHVWNKFSRDYKLNLGINSLYELAFKDHCPLVYYKHALQMGFV